MDKLTGAVIWLIKVFAKLSTDLMWDLAVIGNELRTILGALMDAPITDAAASIEVNWWMLSREQSWLKDKLRQFAEKSYKDNVQGHEKRNTMAPEIDSRKH